MIRTSTYAIAVVVILLGAGCGGGNSSESASGDPMEIEVPVEEKNGSGQSGTATLTSVGDRTEVVLRLQSRSASPVAQRQPAHIHKGTCEKTDPTPAYALQDVVAGTSTSTLDVKLDDLINAAMVVNVHESAATIERYVACGVVGEGEGDDPLGDDRETDY